MTLHALLAIPDAGDDVMVRSGARVGLDGTGSQAVSGVTPTYAWTQTGGPTVTLDDTTSATPAFTAPSVSSSTDLTFSLTVNVGEDSFTDTVTVTVEPSRVVSASVDEDALTVTFDRALKTTSRPASNVFTVTATKSGSGNRTIRGTGAAVKFSNSNKTVTAALESAVTADERLTVRYDKPASGPVLEDTSGTALPSFADRRAVNDGDKAAPRFVSATANGTTMTITFSEALDESVPQQGSVAPFIIRGTPSLNARPLSYAIDGDTVTLTSHANNAVRHDHRQTVTVQYVRPSALANRFKDLSGNVLASFPAQSVTNNTPPAFSSASVNGATLTVAFDGVLDTGSLPAASAFTVTVDGTDQTPAGVAFKSGDATMVELTLAEALLAIAGTVTLGYAAPDANPLRDPDNAKLPLPDFSGEAVTNQTPADATAPRFVSATANGTTMTLTFSEALDESVPQQGSVAPFIIRGTPSLNARPLSYAIDGDTVTLTSHANNAVRHDHRQTVTVQYVRPSALANRFKDLSGNVLASFPAQSVTNNTPPAFSSAEVNGDALTVTFDGDLDTGSVPAASAFTVTVDGTDQTPAAVAFKTGEADKVELTLDPAVARGQQTVTLGYAAPDANALRDADRLHLPVPGFSGESVTNATPADSTAPTFLKDSSSANGTVLTMTFDEALDESSVPQAGVNSALSVLVAGASEKPAGVAVKGKTVTLTLAAADAARHGDTVTVLYVPPDPPAKPLRDLSGNEAAFIGGTAGRVTNNTPPAFDSASVDADGDTLTIDFDGDLDTAGAAPAASAFTVTVDGTDQTPAAVAFKTGEADKVELALDPAVARGQQVVTVGYTIPTTNPLRDPDNAKLPVRGFSGESVTNNTPADSTAPRFVSATANGTTMTITFSEALDESVPQQGSVAPFIIRGTPSLNARPLSYAIDGDTVTLTSHANNAVRHDHRQTVTVQYVRPSALANRFKDLSGNELASFQPQSVTNNTPPAFSSASVNGAALTVTFDGPLDTGSVPAADAFEVTVGGSEVDLAATGAVAVDGKTVTLTLAEAVLRIETVTVGYAAPDANPLRDADRLHLPVPGFSGEAVTNATPADSTAPRFVSATANGTTMTLTFSEALDESVPQQGSVAPFIIRGTPSLNARPLSYAIDGDTVTLTSHANNAARHDHRQTVTVQYVRPSALANRFKDLSGNVLASFPAQSVTNNTPPAFSSAEVNGDALTVTFDGDLDTGSVPAASAFTVTVDGTDQTPAAVAFKTGEADKVELTLAEALLAIDTVTLGYAAPDANALRDADRLHLPVPGFSGESVTNNTPADSTAPRFVSATANGTTMTLTFSEALDESVPQQGSVAPFIIRGTPSLNARPLSYAIDGDTVTLTSHANNAVRHDHRQTVTVQYVRPSALANRFKDLSGNELASFQPQSVTNNTPPAFSSAEVNGDALTVTFDGALDTGSVPAADAFTVTVGGSEADLADTNPVSISGSTVTLTLAEAVAGRLLPVTVSYTAPDSDPLKDAGGENLPVTGFGDTKTVTNNTTDSTVPTLTSATVNATVLTLTFSEPLDESSVPPRTQFSVAGLKNPSAVAVKGYTVTLTLADADAVVHDETVALHYVQPTGQNATPLRDLSGNEVATLTGQLVTNNTPPAFDRARVTGDRLNIVFEADLDTGSVPAASAFTVTVDGTDQTPIGVAFRLRHDPPVVQPHEVELTLRPGVAHGSQTVKVSYTAPSTDPLRDKDNAMSPVAGFSGKTVTNNTSADTRAPEFSSASVSGTTLTLVFDEALDGSVPHDSAFTVTAGGGEMEPADTNPVAVDGAKVTLTLASPVVYGQAVTVGYTKPTLQVARRLRDARGNEVATFAGEDVQNLAPAPLPTVASVAIESTPSVDADGNGTPETYGLGEQIRVRVTWSANVYPDRSAANAALSVRLDVGGTLRPAVLVTSTADSLLFGYTVVAGDSDSDGIDVTPTAAGDIVALTNGATLTDGEGRNASRTSPALPAGAGHKVDGGEAAEEPPVTVVPREFDATVSGVTLTLTFREDLAPAADPARAATALRQAFIVQGGRYQGAPVVNQSPNRVEVAGKVVRLTLGQAVARGRPVTVTYFKEAVAASHRLRFAGGDEVANIDNEPVTNAGGVGAPRLSRASVEGSTLTLIFDQALDESSRPKGLRFEVHGGVIGTPEDRNNPGTGGAWVTGKTVVVTLERAVPASLDGVWVRYVRGNEAKPLRGAGGDVADIQNWPVAVLDGTGPVAVSGSASGTKVTLHFDEALYDEPVHGKPSTGAFTVKVTPSGGTEATRAVNRVDVDGTAVVLTLASAVAAGDGVTVAYAAPAPESPNAIRDVAGYHAASFTLPDQLSDPPRPLTVEGTSDQGAPALADTDPAVADEKGNLTLTFKQTLDPTQVPGIEYFTFSPIRYQGVSGVTVQGKKVVLRLVSALTPCDNDHDIKASYAEPEIAGQKLRSTGNKTVAAFSGVDVVVKYPGAISCEEFMGSFTEGSIVMRARRPFATDAPPRTEWFTVAASGGPVTVTEAAFSPDDPHVLRLGLSREFTADETVTVSYKRPFGARGLWYADGNQIADIVDAPVARKTPAAAPSVEAVALVSDPGDDDMYAAGDAIRVQVTFGEAVTVDTAGGTPRLKLDLGGDEGSGERWAAYESGGGTAALVFGYAAAAGDASAAGVAVIGDTLELNGGTIRSAAGADAALGHAGLAPDPAHRVDAAAPGFASAEVDGAALTVTFGEALDASSAPAGSAFTVTAAPAGGEARAIAGTGTAAVEGAALSLTLAEAVAHGETATLAYAPPEDGPVRDLAGNAAAAFSGQAATNGTPAAAPSVTAVAVVSDAGDDDTYALGETIEIRVTFTEAVSVDTEGGTPGLTIRMDPTWGAFRAAYAGGDGTTALTFTHTVAEPNTSPRGIAVLENTLGGNGGTIRSEATGADAELAHAGLGHDPAHKVNWRLAPSDVTAVAVVSDAGDDDTYALGETIRIRVTFTEAVSVDTEGGTPGLTIKMDPGWGAFRARYAGGDGTEALTFAHTVAEPNTSPRGIAVLANTLETGGGTIRLAATGADARLPHAGLGHDPAHKVDWRLSPQAGPSVVSAAVVSDAGPDGAWGEGETVEAAVTFDRAVAVDAEGGTPTLALIVDGTIRRAAFAGGSGTERLAFAYRVAKADGTATAVRVAASGLKLNGGSVVDAADGTPALLGFGEAPGVTEVSITDEPDGRWEPGDTVEATLRFAEPVTVEGAPRARFVLGGAVRSALWGTPRKAAWAGGSGSDALTFRYTLGEGEGPWTRAVLVSNTLDADGGSIRSAGGGLDAALEHLQGQRTLAPVERPVAVAGVAVVSDAGDDGTYALGETIEIRVTFGAAVSVDTAGGTPRLAIRMDPGWGTFRAQYAGGDGTESLTFTHTVVEPNTSPRGIAVLANTLETNGGAIRSASGKDADLAHAGLDHDPAHKVNWRLSPAGAPTVTGVAVVSDAGSDDTYGLGETIRIQVTFSEAVNVDATGGTPRLAIRMDPGWGTFPAAWEGGSGTSRLIFAHTVVPPNTSPRGIAVLANTLEANGGAIRSAATGIGAGLAHAGLPHDPRHKVDWRPELSVADAEAREGIDATVDFAVTLRGDASSGAVVEFATADGTATAWRDYRPVQGVLIFLPDERRKVVSVPIFDDGHHEGRETFAFRLLNAQGARIVDGEATGTIINSDPVPEAWLARFGRSVAESNLDAIRERLGADRSPGLSGSFAGQPLPGPEASAGDPQAAATEGTRTGTDSLYGSRIASLADPASPAEEAALAFRDAGAGQARNPVDPAGEDGFLALRSFLADGDDEDGPETPEITSDDVLLGTSFVMTRDAGTGASHGFWGRAGRSGFSGRDGDTDVEGQVTGVMLGTDWKRKGTLLGIVVSESRGTGSYSGASSGDIDATLTALVPWAGREIGDGLSVWGALGIGRGDMTVTPEGTDPIDAGIGWSMAAAGAEGALAPGERLLGADLGWHADALVTRTTSDAATDLAATSGATTRLRLGVTADWQRTLESGAAFGPRLEAGLRHDGGDAETGFGLEIGGGIGFSDPASGLTVTVDGRTLALHEDGAFDSWGLSLGLSWDPRPETRRGWSLSAKQGFGGASSGGVDALLGPEAFPGLQGTEGEAAWSLEAAHGTGLGNGMVGSRYGRASGGGGEGSLRLGWRVEPDASHAADASVDVWAQPGTDGAGHEAGAGLEWRW